MEVEVASRDRRQMLRKGQLIFLKPIRRVLTILGVSLSLGVASIWMTSFSDEHYRALHICGL
jgi:hypothetical protein